MSAQIDPLLARVEPRPVPLIEPPARQRRVAGVRVSALIEIVSFVLIALVLDALWGAHNRFADVPLHPFWIVVVLAAVYYGTNEGLAAVVIASAAVLVGHLPIQRIDEDLNAWLLRTTLQPLAWCAAAMVLGAINDSFRRRFGALGDQLSEAREQLRTITDGYTQLHTLKQHLEARVASQLCTVYAMYNASRAIERQGVGEVLVGVNELVRTVMKPDKFSLFLLNGACLEAVANEGWLADDPYSRDIESSSPLYQAVVTNRRYLLITHPADEPLLRGEGLMAGPLINSETGELVGMLKIEAIGFLELNLSSVQNFRVLCDWVGAALANAQRVENLLKSHCFGPAQHGAPQTGFDRQQDLLAHLAQHSGLAASVLNIELDAVAAGAAAGLSDARWARAVSNVATQVLDATQLCCDYRCSARSYTLLLPGAGPARAQAIAQAFKSRLSDELTAIGVTTPPRVDVEPLGGGLS